MIPISYQVYTKHLTFNIQISPDFLVKRLLITFESNVGIQVLTNN
jgi:hypothetical protein